MKIIRDSLYLGPADKGAVAAIGNFDGVHLGHRAVIDLASAQATTAAAPLAVMTFEPHPRQYFAPQSPAFRLMNADAKAHRLAKLGVDLLFEIPFNAGLASLTPRDFAKTILVDRLGLSHVVVGGDFRFGANRAGQAADLVALGAEMGFGVTVAPMVELGLAEVSSTAIRTALGEGRPRDAAQMLGHWHRIDGPVIKGDQRGRELGYPTANMSIDGLHSPKFGVYAVKVDVLDGPYQGTYNGAASVGVRPTFGVNKPNFESFLFDFKGDLYGTQVSVALIDYLRGEEKFANLEDLITQMDADCVLARAILADV